MINKTIPPILFIKFIFFLKFLENIKNFWTNNPDKINGTAKPIEYKDNKIIEGNPDKIKFVTDVWKFTRNINNKSPNWYLAEIASK